MRQVQSSVRNTRNRFSEAMAEANGLIPRAVPTMHARVRVTEEGELDFLTHTRQAECINKRVPE